MAFEIAVSDPAVQSAIIQSAGGILSAAIAAIAAALIGHQIAGRKRLKSLLQTAVSDVQFLLAVETAHCELHKEVSEESFKQRIREVAREQGNEWSGKFTPGRARTMSILNGD